MAAVTRVKARPCTPVGYEVNDKGTAGEAITAGDQLVITGASGGVSTWGKAPTNATEAQGMAMQDFYAGQGGISVMIQGEMDGFSGMTPGAPLYPSSTVGGGLDTTAPAGAVARVRALTASRVRVNYV